jgi:hypothetical protein
MYVVKHSDGIQHKFGISGYKLYNDDESDYKIRGFMLEVDLCEQLDKLQERLEVIDKKSKSRKNKFIRVLDGISITDQYVRIKDISQVSIAHPTVDSYYVMITIADGFEYMYSQHAAYETALASLNALLAKL